MADIKKGTKRRAENMEVEDGSETMLKRPNFSEAKPENIKQARSKRAVYIPSNRYSALKENWKKILEPITKQLKLQIMYDIKRSTVFLRTCDQTKDIGALQKAAEFIRAFSLGFSIDDAMAIIRTEQLFLESFDVTHVKTLKDDHLSRAIGRIAGSGGKVKYTIENVTKTRIILAGTKVSIMGSYKSIGIARRAICNLIMGSPPSKVYGKMRAIVASSMQKF